MFRLDRGRSAWLVATLTGLVLCGASSPAAASVQDAATAPVAADDERSAREEIAAALAGLIVDGMSTEQRAAVVVMGHVGGTDAGALERYVEGGDLGGFILMGSNVPPDPAALPALTQAVDGADGALPRLVAVDQEGGPVSRLAWDRGPAGAQLSALSPEAVSAAFDARGGLLEEAGVTVNFGIVADVGTATSGFIRPRALGGDAASAAQRVAAAVQGERPHAFSTIKHFPGHGAAPGDSHSVIPSTSMPLEEWRAEHAPPFEAGVEAGAALVMSGHLRFTAVDDAPASVSPEWYRILREDLGFEGVAITDDLGMLLASGDPRYADPARSAVAAVAAGADMVLMVAGSNAGTATAMVDGISAAAEAGEIPEERLREAATRVATLRVLASGLLDGAAFD